MTPAVPRWRDLDNPRKLGSDPPRGVGDHDGRAGVLKPLSLTRFLRHPPAQISGIQRQCLVITSCRRPFEGAPVVMLTLAQGSGPTNPDHQRQSTRRLLTRFRLRKSPL